MADNAAAHQLVEMDPYFDMPDDNIAQIIGLINGYEEFGAPMKLVQFGLPDADGGTVVLPDDDPEAGEAAYTLDLKNLGADNRALRWRLSDDTVALTLTSTGLTLGTDATMLSGVNMFFANEVADKIRLSGTALAGYGVGTNTGELTLYSAGDLDYADAAGLAVRSNTVGGTGYLIWHAGNDGAGSSLDAGYFAGEDISNFALLDAALNTFEGDMAVEGELTVDGNVTLGSGLSDIVDISGSGSTGGDWDVGGELTVDGNSVLGNDAADVTTVTGVMAVTGDVTVSGITTLGNGGTDSTKVFGRLYLQDNATVGTGVYSITASTGSDPSLRFIDNGGDTVLTLYPSTGTTYQAVVNGDLNVTDYLEVDGDSNINGSLQVDTNLDVFGDFYVAGNTELGSNSSDQTTVKGLLYAEHTFRLGDYDTTDFKVYDDNGDYWEANGKFYIYVGTNKKSIPYWD